MTISEVDFQIISDYVHVITGIYLEYQKEYLINQKLKAFVEEKFHSDFSKFAHHLKTSSLSIDDQLRIISAVTTNETSFFRDTHPYSTLHDYILPEILKNKTALHIWSAGCSTGQEVYSLAILLYEYLNQIPDKKITVYIIGTDIDPFVLDKAKAGQYNSIEINRGLTKEQIEKYFFKTEKDLWIVKDFLKENIHFEQQSLHLICKQNIFKNFDLILARNVLIYFQEQTKKKIIDYFHRSLNSKGLLILGASESLYGITTKFTHLNFDKSIVYKKIG